MKKIALITLLTGLFLGHPYLLDANTCEDSFPPINLGLCGEWILQGDLLYWSSCSEGYFFCFTRTVVSQSDGRSIIAANIREHFKEPENPTAPGFRFGLSYLQPQCCLETSLKWTHYQVEEGASHHKDNDILLPFSTFRPGRDSYGYAPQGGYETELYANQVRGNWELTLNFVDLAFGYPTNWCQHIDFHPHVDLRFFHLEQELHIRSIGELVNPFVDVFTRFIPEVEGDFSANEKLQLEYWAMGPRFAIDLDWEITPGFGLYGGVGGAIVFGEKKSHARFELNRTNTIGTNGEPLQGSDCATDLDIHQKRHSSRCCSRAILDLQVGLFWHWIPCDCPFAILTKLGWEHHAFFNQGMGDLDAASRGFLSRDGNSLTTQGLDLSFQLIF